MILRPFEENPIRKQFEIFETLCDDVFSRRSVYVVISSAPGLGKTHRLKALAKKYKIGWHPRRPGSRRGLLEVLYECRNERVIFIDDLGSLFAPECIDILKVVLDSYPVRVISHEVSGNKSMPEFEFKAGIIMGTNKNFFDPKGFHPGTYKDYILPLRNRAQFIHVSFEPTDLYEFACHTATTGGMFRRTLIYAEPPGQQRRRLALSLVEANDTLAHIREHATRYPSLSPRTLEMFARMHIGRSKEEWLRLVDSQLLPAPIREFKGALPLFVERPPNSPEPPTSEPTKIGAAAPRPAPLPVASKITLQVMALKGLAEIFPEGATTQELLAHIRELGRDVTRTGLSSQLTRLRQSGALDRHDHVWQLKHPT